MTQCHLPYKWRRYTVWILVLYQTQAFFATKLLKLVAQVDHQVPAHSRRDHLYCSRLHTAVESTRPRQQFSCMQSVQPNVVPFLWLWPCYSALQNWHIISINNPLVLWHCWMDDKRASGAQFTKKILRSVLRLSYNFLQIWPRPVNSSLQQFPKVYFCGPNVAGVVTLKVAVLSEMKLI